MHLKAARDYGKAFLRNQINDDYTLDAELILLYVLQDKYASRAALLAHFDDDILDEQYSAYKDLLQKRASGICTAYITAHKEFRHLDLYVNNNVLVPRPDTEILVDAALEYIDIADTQKIKCLDMCTGSGAVAISIKYERPDVNVFASDISGPALEVVKKNAHKYNIYKQLTLYQSDVFNNINNTFNIITANAPYISSACIDGLQIEVRSEPHIALDGGEDGLSIIKRIIEDAPEHLYNSGVLLLEVDPAQMDAIQALLLKRGYSNAARYQDLSGKDRVIAAKFLSM
jgi:release factor glutamine methyltransferase